MLVLMAGLPGTGKTTVACALALRTSGTVLNKDSIRAVLFEPRDLEYSTEQDDFVLEAMLQTAAYLFSKDSSRVIFLDGRPFSKAYQIDRVKRFAVSQKQSWQILECVCSEASARQRLQAQAATDEHPAANRDFALYLEIKDAFEAIAAPKAVINTDEPIEACVDLALAAMCRARIH